MILADGSGETPFATQLAPLVAWLSQHAGSALPDTPAKLNLIKTRLAFHGETSSAAFHHETPGWFVLRIHRRHALPLGELGIRSSWLYIDWTEVCAECGTGQVDFDPLGDPDGWSSSWAIYQLFDDGFETGNLAEWCDALPNYDPTHCSLEIEGDFPWPL